MKKEEFDKKIAEIEGERYALLQKMMILADAEGHSFDVDYGGQNTYIPEGGKTTCTNCEGSGTVTKCTYGLPYPTDPRTKHGYRYRRLTPVEQHKYDAELKAYRDAITYTEKTCDECNGTGQVTTDDCGWQSSYC